MILSDAICCRNILQGFDLASKTCNTLPQQNVALQIAARCAGYMVTIFNNNKLPRLISPLRCLVEEFTRDAMLEKLRTKLRV